MEAVIKIGEKNTCVGCGNLQKTIILDEDDLPLCLQCGLARRKYKPLRPGEFNPRDIAILGGDPSL